MGEAQAGAREGRGEGGRERLEARRTHLQSVAYLIRLITPFIFTGLSSWWIDCRGRAAPNEAS